MTKVGGKREIEREIWRQEEDNNVGKLRKKERNKVYKKTAKI
jgi:hypothetical protein